MTFEVREGQGALFANERKEGQQPDYNGNVRINGVLYRLAGWKRTSKAGQRWLSLKAQPDQGTAQSPSDTPPATAQAPKAAKDFNDDIPF